MDTYKFGVKFFLTGPQSKPLKNYIPVFHGWIQRQALPGHLLIDVHDYSHVYQGPGILLVAHEANISVDESEGHRGLVYTRKQPATLQKTVAAARAAVALLGEPLETGSCEVFVNDRLASVTADAVAAATGGTASVKATDPRQRATFVVRF
jgi:hypothetical protein